MKTIESKVKILTICSQNVGRSPMAGGYFREFYPQATVITAGADKRKEIRRVRKKYGDRPASGVIQAMFEDGINISSERIKRVTRSMVRDATAIFALCEEDKLPKFVRRLGEDKIINYAVSDPAPGDGSAPELEKLRITRDEIKKGVIEVTASGQRYLDKAQSTAENDRLSSFVEMGLPKEKLEAGEPFVLVELGSGKPIIAVTAGMHGNEDTGVRIIADLKNNISVGEGQGTLRLVVANTPALLEKKRFIVRDLNRAFPGKVDKEGESGLAPKISKLIEDADVVLDLHTTSSKDCPAFAIVDKRPEAIKLAEATGIENIVVFPRPKKYAMVDFTRLGIGLELGHEGSEETFRTGLNAVKSVAAAYGLTNEPTKNNDQKKYFQIYGQVFIQDSNFLSADTLDNFKPVKQGEILGYSAFDENPIRASEDFYPVFVSEGAYQGTICLKAKEVKREEIIERELEPIRKVENLFGTKHPVIGAVHFLPMIGYGEFSVDEVYNQAKADLKALEQGGADGVIFENNYDVPHKITVEPETIAEMTKLITRLRKDTNLPIGVSVLWNDYRAALAIAKVAGADFIRVPVFVDDVRTNYGDETGKPEAVTQYRQQISADNVLLFTDIHVKHSQILNTDTIEQSAKNAIAAGSDGLIVTGKWTGDAPDMTDLQQVREAVGSFPIILGSGVSEENVSQLFEIADGAIVSTSLKEGENEDDEVNVKPYSRRISKDRVERLMKATDRYADNSEEKARLL